MIVQTHVFTIYRHNLVDSDGTKASRFRSALTPRCWGDLTYKKEKTDNFVMGVLQHCSTPTVCRSCTSNPFRNKACLQGRVDQKTPKYCVRAQPITNLEAGDCCFQTLIHFQGNVFSRKMKWCSSMKTQRARTSILLSLLTNLKTPQSSPKLSPVINLTEIQFSWIFICTTALCIWSGHGVQAISSVTYNSQLVKLCPIDSSTQVWCINTWGQHWKCSPKK